MTAAARALPALGLLLCACSSSDSLGHGTVDLGTGEIYFEMLEDGERVPLIAGSQGGFHVWMSFLAYGFAGPRLDTVISTELLREDGEPFANADPSSDATLRSELPIKLTPHDEGGLEFIGWPGIVNTSLCPLDRELVLRVTFSEAGIVASDEKRVIVDGTGISRLPPSCEASAGDAP